MGPGPSPELEAQVQNVLDTAQENGDMRAMELGSATDRVKRLESAGDVFDGPYVQRSSEFQNTPGQGIGELQTVNVNAAVVKRGENGARTEFEAKTGGVYNMDTKQNEYVRVTRETSSGEKYEHRFKNPDTARKFASLITKQVATRGQNASSQEKAA